jgi:hypothetical protein
MAAGISLIKKTPQHYDDLLAVSVLKGLQTPSPNMRLADHLGNTCHFHTVKFSNGSFEDVEDKRYNYA